MMDFDQKVATLEEKILQLEDKVERLEQEKWLLLGGKLDDPNHPYYAWLLWSNTTEEKRAWIEKVLAILDSRLQGEEVPDFLRQKPVPGIPTDELLRSEIPNYKDTCRIFMRLSGFEDPDAILEMLKAMYVQGVFRDLCRHLLTDAGEALPPLLKE